jgi:oligogalacturonide lyase
MQRVPSVLALFCGALIAVPTTAQPGDDSPADWIDPATGHRVIRLSSEPGTASFYFHQNPYTEKGDKMAVSVKGGLASIDLTTLGVKPPKVERIAEGNAKSPIVGKKTRQVFYVKGSSIFATHLDTKATREIVKLPTGYSGASGLALNADETLLASSGSDPKGKELAKDKGKAGRSMALFTVNVQTGEIKRIHYATDWLNHTQFSPTDPEQILFCHEGTWDYVDRIWTIRADGTGLRKMHTRTMDHEIFGHEFFGHDGNMIWYDLQTPRSKVFWLAGVNLTSGDRVRYRMEREQWSVHFNQSPDGKLFAGDGGGLKSVAAPGNGQWIYLFTPQNGAMKDGWVNGTLKAERLVDLSKHNYRLEPNVTFTPDGRWVVFRSNMHGPTHVYAVEVRKARVSETAPAR